MPHLVQTEMDVIFHGSITVPPSPAARESSKAFFDSINRDAFQLPLRHIVRRYLTLTPLFHDLFSVMLFEYDSLHFLQKELLRIAYIPTQELTPMKI
jgi:hypothetical protein